MKQSSAYNIDIYNKIFALPKELKAEVLQFAEFLTAKNLPSTKIKEREFGCAKNAFVIGENFDEPLDEFKDYM